MRPSNQERIEALRVRRAEIDAELSRLSARARADSRKQDTRRKILIGAVILQEMQDKPEFRDYVHSLLKARLSKPRDRELFQFEVA